MRILDGELDGDVTFDENDDARLGLTLSSPLPGQHLKIAEATASSKDMPFPSRQSFGW